MTLFHICGGMGSGKTLAMTYLALVMKHQGHSIIANYVLKFRDLDAIDLEQICDLRNGAVFLDEFWTWADSRRATTKQNISLSHFLLQSRKRHLHIFTTQQVLTQLDKRMRAVANGFFIPEFDKRTQTCTLSCMDDMQQERRRFTFFAQPLFALYDTDEVIRDVE